MMKYMTVSDINLFAIFCLQTSPSSWGFCWPCQQYNYKCRNAVEDHLPKPSLTFLLPSCQAAAITPGLGLSPVVNAVIRSINVVREKGVVMSK